MAEKFSDNSNDRAYFTIIPNIIDELDLSPLAIALYVHSKRWAGAKNHRPLGVKKLKEKFRASSDSIADAKKELEKHLLIRVKRFEPKFGKPDEVTVADIWSRNMKHFQPDSPAPEPHEVQVDGPEPHEVQPRTSRGTVPNPRRYAIEKESLKERNTLSAKTPTDDEIIFAYWQSIHHKERCTFTKERRKAVRARLEKYSVADIMLAIDGCKKSPMHQGNNDRGTVYDDLELICRNDTKLEKFMGYGEQKEANGELTCGQCRNGLIQVQHPDGSKGWAECQHGQQTAGAAVGQ